MQAQRTLLPLDKARELYPAIPPNRTVYRLRYQGDMRHVFKKFMGRVVVDIDEWLREVDREDLQ